MDKTALPSSKPSANQARPHQSRSCSPTTRRPTRPSLDRHLALALRPSRYRCRVPGPVMSVRTWPATTKHGAHAPRLPPPDYRATSAHPTTSPRASRWQRRHDQQQHDMDSLAHEHAATELHGQAAPTTTTPQDISRPRPSRRGLLVACMPGSNTTWTNAHVQVATTPHGMHAPRPPRPPEPLPHRHTCRAANK